MMERVGFAGTGTMGFGMSANLVKAGFKVFVYNRTRAKAQAVAGATVVNTPSELCDKAEVIFTCVSNDAALRDVLFSANGIISAVSQKNILVDSSTTSVDFTAEIAGKCREKGVEFLDAPVTGSKKGAEEGTLMFMFGGGKDAFEKCRPAFEAMGKRFVHCGPNTYGQRMKIALNTTMAMLLEGYLEGVVFALKNGVPLDAIHEVLDNSGAKCGVASAKMPAIIVRSFEPHFLLELMNKDMKLAESEIKRLGLQLPLAQEVIKILQQSVDGNPGKEDWSAITKLLEGRNNVKIDSHASS
ncbi:NAD(P)-dependent oxidoreductase [Candidatus Woesearchaeota archaeon]|nr:NAD(P)-dependent oxidoreductase [Candidatus Woesearchaeota archaeon]